MRLKDVGIVSRAMIEPRRLGPSVVHYSIPALEATGGPLTEASAGIESGKLRVRCGDVMISRLNPRKSRVIRVAHHDLPAVASSEFVVIHPRKYDGAFLTYFLSSEAVTTYLSSAVKSVTRSHQRVEPETILGLALPEVAVPHQVAIVDFLDRECGEIDAFIGDQERLIALLLERRAATISNAVRRGLDPLTPLRDSGIAWLREVPQHWRVAGLSRFGRAFGGAGFPVELQGVDGEDLPFYKVNALARADQDDVIRFVDDTISPETARSLRARVFPSGTIVIAKIGAALLLGRVRFLDKDACIDNNMLGVELARDVVPSFVRYAMTLFAFERIVLPGAVPSLDIDALLSYELGWPAAEEQLQIARHLDHETSAIDAAIADAREAIALSKERRAALISAAVTGQIDVTGRLEASK